MGCWQFFKTQKPLQERQEPQPPVAQVPFTQNENFATERNLVPSNPKRKSYLGQLFAQKKEQECNRTNRFTRPQNNHIFIINPNEKPKEAQNAIKVNLQDRLETIRKYIQQNGQELKTCSICTLPYDLQNRQPIMICMNQHTICTQCVNQLWQKGIKKCPFDKRPFDIKDTKKNRIMIQFMQHKSQMQ